MTHARLSAAIATVVIATALIASFTISSGGGGVLERERQSATTAVTGVVQEFSGDTIALRQGDDVLSYRLAAEASEDTRSSLRVSQQLRVEATLQIEGSGDSAVVVSATKLLPDGVKTFGDMTLDGKPAYPPVKLKKGERAIDVPITEVRVWDEEAMARFHASSTAGESKKEKRLIVDRLHPEAADVSTDDLSRVELGDRRETVIEKLGKPGTSLAGSSRSQTCLFWPRSDDADLMAGVCFNQAHEAVSRVSSRQRPDAQRPAPSKQPVETVVKGDRADKLIARGAAGVGRRG